MLATTLAMTMARLNEWWINFKPHAATQTTPANALAHSRRNARLLRDANVLCFSKEAKRFFSTLAADPALFHAPKGNAQIAHQPAIYPDRAGVDLLGNAMGAA